MAGSYTALKGITNINDATLDEQLQENLISFFDWSLLNVGGFFNVQRSYNTSASLLTPHSGNSGVVWESSHGNWVWEAVPNAINISGIYVNNTFIPNNGSTYNINYPDGIVVFNSPISLTSTVELDYSYKSFNFYDSDSPWFQQLVVEPMEGPMIVDLLAKHKAYLPMVIVEIPGGRVLSPFELGDGQSRIRQPILFHVIASNKQHRSKLIDAITFQYGKTIWLYNTNKIADANAFPLDGNGSPVGGAMAYPALVDTFRWKRCWFQNMSTQLVSRQLSLYRAVIRTTIELYN